MNKVVTIVLADDHPFFRKGFKDALEIFPRFKVVGEADNGKALLSLCKRLQPQLVFTDLIMPEMDGFTAIGQLRKKKNPPVIIAFTSVENDGDRYNTLAAGAKGYLSKAMKLTELVAAVEMIIDTAAYYCQFTNPVLDDFIKQYEFPHLPPKNHGFTNRELQVWKLLQDEKTSNEIGAELFITAKTVQYHRQNLYEKTGTKNIVGLILYGLKHKILKRKDGGDR